MKKFSVCLLAVITGAIVFSACTEKIKGCTNNNATNYNSKAQTDDGSCRFQRDFVFHQDHLTSEKLVAAGTTSVKVFVDNKLAGTYPASAFVTSDYTCDNGLIKYTHHWNKEVIFTATIVVKDQHEKELKKWTNAGYAGGECAKMSIFFYP